MRKTILPLGLLLGFLSLILLVTIKPYGWNLTAMFHMDHIIADVHPLPRGFVMLGVPSYDGAQYYQVARNIPAFLNPSRWSSIDASPPGSYAYQRFLLPLAARIASLGNDRALPVAFISINILALLGTLIVVLRWKPHNPLYALALTLSPTAAVAMHFTLAEPLTLLLITAVIIRYRKYGSIGLSEIILLSLAVLCREVIILLVAFFVGYSILRKRWRDVLLLMIPVLVFLGLHTWIYLVFGDVPFLISAGAKEFPGAAATKILLGIKGYDRYSLSAIALFLGLVLPATFWSAWQLIRTWSLKFLPLGALAFLCIMLTMPGYIWGSITSIGRVITPMYPFLILSCAERDTWPARLLATSTMILGIATSIGLALMMHPFTITM